MEMIVSRLEKLRTICESCSNCALRAGRTKMVFGEGNVNAPVMFIGEGPGRDEDISGRPFVGRSGKLLRAMIQAIDLSDKCFIANIVKCRPPNNRPPEDEEIETCVKFLNKQIEIIAPQLLILLGRTAVKGLVPEHKAIPLDVLRRNSKEGSIFYNGVPALIMYHPSALLRDPSKKIGAAEDFRFLQKKFV
jgi:uracil-DNA glycosylase family 4